MDFTAVFTVKFNINSICEGMNITNLTLLIFNEVMSKNKLGSFIYALCTITLVYFSYVLVCLMWNINLVAWKEEEVH